MLNWIIFDDPLFQVTKTQEYIFYYSKEMTYMKWKDSIKSVSVPEIRHVTQIIYISITQNTRLEYFVL